MEQSIVEMTSIASIAIALFGAAFCLMQKEYSHVSRSFAVFLAAVAVSNVPDAFARMFQSLDGVPDQKLDLIIWLPSALCVAPLFWIYVFILTSTAQRRPPRLYRHLVLPALGVLGGVLVAFSSQDIWAALVLEGTVPSTGWPLALVTFVVLLQIAQYPQIAIYLVLIVRRMIRYRLMLRDYYASTEEHELRWIYVIGGLAWLYWVVRTLLLVSDIDPKWTEATPVAFIIVGLASLALVAAMTLWGLRQRPPLVPGPADTLPLEITAKTSSEQTIEKYEKSALSVEASTRIARKLRAAMEKDHLHRDPNLSLWVLARHIGASPNFISQTLSEVIGESFFDFVNGYRIAEAMTLLSTTNDTVLAITYEVGFNARSSFYNAFKRVTGETPTQYRKRLSHPAGMDDDKAQLGDT
jgi:AraC-like DNA-binding protein